LRYIADKTGRFAKRPYYENDELDFECEQIITAFMREQLGEVRFPVSTDLLTKLIERDAEDLDLYADLTLEGPDVEAVTEFHSGRKPRVKVTSELSERVQHEHRLRTTLSHEYGHVKFHAYLWELASQAPRLFPEPALQATQKCKRDTILDASQVDWMEWQAGYVCGALLMPKTEVTKIVSTYFRTRGILGTISVNSAVADDLQTLVAEAFEVSREAARVRLLKLNLLVPLACGRSLFHT
jgi:hypothetical protein